MAESTSRLAKLLLRFAPSLGRLRRVPILGVLLSWTSRKLVPPDSLIWCKSSAAPPKVCGFA